MATEIELKYLVEGENIASSLRDLLTSKNISFQEKTKSLKNCYFDTGDQILRSLDMGLRVRSIGESNEQTIKTAGIEVGGLHQRPEYNIDIENTFPDLSLFPTSLWRDELQRNSIQDSLTSIFTTHFERTTWLLDLPNGSQIEMAYDQGVIEVDGKAESIHEVELELVSGERENIFEFAKALFTILSMRPGVKSKAARGYALWQSTIDPDVSSEIVEETQITLVPANHALSIQMMFVAGVKYALNRMQRQIDEYLSDPKLIKLGLIKESLQLISHGTGMLAPYLNKEQASVSNDVNFFIKSLDWLDDAIHMRELVTKSGNFRKKVEYSEQLLATIKIERSRLADSSNIEALFLSQRFNELQLALLEIVLQSTNSSQAEPPISEYSSLCLEQSLEQLLAAVSTNNKKDVEYYLSLGETLEHSLLTGYWFGSLYSLEEREEYRAPWLDILQGVNELKTLNLLHKQLILLDDAPRKLVVWLDSKIENLLAALEQSKRLAVSIPPYWCK